MNSKRTRVFANSRCASRAILASAFAVIALAATPAFASAAVWSFQSTPAFQPESKVELTDVSCLTANSCIAVGAAAWFASGEWKGRYVVGEYWNGTEWKVQPVNEKATPTKLRGVSCSFSTACEAVGSGGTSSPGAAAAWNGTEWKSQSVPRPVGSIEDHLNSVSCRESTNCMAVGRYATGTFPNITVDGYAERWNGEAWVVASVAKPAGSTRFELEGVSCTSTTACIAVGNYNTSSARRTLAESWNGTEWKVQSTPNPEGAAGEFGGLKRLSCTSSTACTAVGEWGSLGTETPFAERWNGTEWKIQTVPRPETRSGARLAAVSCTSSTACTAVGGSSGVANEGPSKMLAEFWNGTEWKVQSTPQPAEVTKTVLFGVSCSSSITCSAVGTDAKEGVAAEQAFAEIYH
jgi:hypothetical protein